MPHGKGARRPQNPALGKRGLRAKRSLRPPAARSLLAATLREPPAGNARPTAPWRPLATRW
eukprot:5878131-Lingulodinium_polyedra.AAC.1